MFEEGGFYVGTDNSVLTKLRNSPREYLGRVHEGDGDFHQQPPTFDNSV